MGEYSKGEYPEGTIKYVPSEYSPSRDEIIGIKTRGYPYVLVLPPGSWSDKDAVEKIWNKILDDGDEPVYVRVKTEWFGSLMTYIEIEILMIDKTGSPGIGLILLAIAGIIISTAILIDRLYFVLTPSEEYIKKKQAEASGSLADAIKAIAVVAGIGVGAWIVGKAVGWETVRKGVRRGYRYVKEKAPEVKRRVVKIVKAIRG